MTTVVGAGGGGVPVPASNELAAFLAAERAQESGGSYTAQNPGGASGAYQFEPSTWAEWVTRAGFPQFAGVPAAQAPAQVQDAAAAAMATADYGTSGGNWLTTAEDWYYPAVAGTPAANTYTPPGNRLTVGQYGADVIARMTSILSDPATAPAGSSAPAMQTGIVGNFAGDLAGPVIGWIDNYAMRAALFVIGGAAVLFGLIHLTRPKPPATTPAGGGGGGRPGSAENRPTAPDSPRTAPTATETAPAAPAAAEAAA